MFNTLEQFCNHAFLVDKRSGMGTLKYKFVLGNGVLHIEILEDLDPSGKPAGGTYTKSPVSLEKILTQLKGGVRVSLNNNDEAFWHAILEHQELASDAGQVRGTLPLG